MAAAVKVPSCSERLNAGLLFRGSLLYCDGLCGGLLHGNRLCFGGARPWSDGRCSDGHDPVFDDVLILCHGASEALACMSLRGGVVVLEFL